MPRRDPLLGRDSSPETKAQRAFTMQAEQDIWDIGTTVTKPVEEPLRASAFRMLLNSGRFPFEQDHSGSISEPRIAWLTEIQNLDLTSLLPELIEGLTESEESYHRVVAMALSDLLKHAHTDKIAEALSPMVIAIKKILRMRNTIIARRVLTFMKELCIVQMALGPDLAYYMHEILVNFNPYMQPERMKNQEDSIMYEQRLRPDIIEEVFLLMQYFASIAGSEYDLAVRSMKKAIPLYQVSNPSSN